MTAPHVGNTGVNDEDPSREDLGGRVRRPRPRPGPSSWRRGAASTTSSGRRAWSGSPASTPGADPAPARARGDARGISSTGAARTTCWTGAGPARDGRRRAGRRGLDRETYVVPAVGEKRLTVAALDLGIKAMTPTGCGRAGIEVHVLPATATLDDVLRRRPDGLFYSNGPGDPAARPRQVELLQAR
jgi:carbamoyl-phosphate synthase small subunit